MYLRFDDKYIRSKNKISKKVSLNFINETENIFKNNPSHIKLNLKNIICRRDKDK